MRLLEKQFGNGIKFEFATTTHNLVVDVVECDSALNPHGCDQAGK